MQIKNVRDHRTEDRMESFFLAETTKYLYLLFDPDNALNSNGGSGTIIDTPRGQCLIEAGGYVFNTEAHPVDTAALRCCHDEMRYPLAGYAPDRFGDRFEWQLREEESVAEDAVAHEESVRKEDEVRNRITSTVIDVGVRVDSTEATRNKIVAEILSVLKEKKFNEENAKFVGEEDATREDVVQPKDDSIILSVPVVATSDDDDEEASTGVGEVTDVSTMDNEIDAVDDGSVEIDQEPEHVPPNEFVAFDEESADTTPVPVAQQISSDFQDQRPQSSSDQLLADIAAKEKGTNNITAFVHSILKSALPAAPRFDAQRLLEKVRSNEALRLLQRPGPRNGTQPAVGYRWLTCRAQPFLHRISVMGEFF